jgi:SAM-dependent methyltransferase
MNNRDKWTSNRWLWDEGRKKYKPNPAVIYAGSLHMAYIQIDAYYPLIREHMSGRLLDCACDKVPYFEMYKDLITENVCTDWEVTRRENPWVDFYSDLNSPLDRTLLPDNHFDSILMTDAIAHIKDPIRLFGEFSRMLKPGGKLMLTATFINWMGEPPHEYGRYTEYAYRNFCEANNLTVLHLKPYGGHADVLLDTLNKGMTGKISNRLFMMFRNIAVRTGWYKRNRETTSGRYPIGYCLVAQKPNT